MAVGKRVVSGELLVVS